MFGWKLEIQSKCLVPLYAILNPQLLATPSYNFFLHFHQFHSGFGLFLHSDIRINFECTNSEEMHSAYRGTACFGVADLLLQIIAATNYFSLCQI